MDRRKFLQAACAGAAAAVVPATGAPEKTTTLRIKCAELHCYAGHVLNSAGERMRPLVIDRACLIVEES